MTRPPAVKRRTAPWVAFPAQLIDDPRLWAMCSALSAGVSSGSSTGSSVGSSHAFPVALVAGHVAFLWGRMLEACPSGVIGTTPDQLLEMWAGWHGAPGAFAGAFRDAFAPDGQLRDWQTLNEGFLKRRAYDRDRKAGDSPEVPQDIPRELPTERPRETPRDVPRATRAEVPTDDLDRDRDLTTPSATTPSTARDALRIGAAPLSEWCDADVPAGAWPEADAWVRAGPPGERAGVLATAMARVHRESGPDAVTQFLATLNMLLKDGDMVEGKRVVPCGDEPVIGMREWVTNGNGKLASFRQFIVRAARSAKAAAAPIDTAPGPTQSRSSTRKGEPSVEGIASFRRLRDKLNDIGGHMRFTPEMHRMLSAPEKAGLSAVGGARAITMVAPDKVHWMELEWSKAYDRTPHAAAS